MEAINNATKAYAGMEPYNVEYYIAKYGTVEKLTKDYEGAIEYLRMQYRQFENNPRKGGRYRREKMKHIQRQAKAIFDELLQVSRAMKEYFAATAPETPRISTETAETVNVSAEGEKAAARAKYRVSRLGGYKIIVGDREQGKVIAVLMSVNGHNTIEINDESAHIATMGEKPLRIDKPIMQLSDTEVLELIYDHIEPPQSPETPQSIKRTTDTPKPRETARKPQNRGIGCARMTRHSGLGAGGYEILDNASATLAAMSVPRECSTADYW